MTDRDELAITIPPDERFAYLETTGRSSGMPRETELSYAAADQRIFLISASGNRTDWVKNLHQTRDVRVRIDETWYIGTARTSALDAAEEARARQLIMAKRGPHVHSTDWIRNGLVVYIDVAAMTGERR